LKVPFGGFGAALRTPPLALPHWSVLTQPERGRTTIAAMPSSASGASEIEWPARWQCEAIEAVLPYLGSDERLRIQVDDPKKAIQATLIEVTSASSTGQR
jgi:hypothetical protein